PARPLGPPVPRRLGAVAAHNRAMPVTSLRPVGPPTQLAASYSGDATFASGAWALTYINSGDQGPDPIIDCPGCCGSASVGGASSNLDGPGVPSGFTEAPVRYFDGVVSLKTDDLL